MIILTGIQIKSKLFHEIKKQVRRYYSLDLYEGSQSMQSNIANGTDSFLKSRTAHFRSNLRRIVRFAAKQNFTYELITSSNNSAQVFQRMMSIERNSWKYLDGSSIFLIQKYKLFYANLLERLAQNNRLRLIFVRQDQRDCAYIFGGILHKTYKGFQLSYDDNFASFSLGHLSQWKMIEQLVSENIHIYDLGMPMDYKRPWSDYTINMLNITITHR
jgi:CelD/BcsL family acetyltransferase involved in cellulose biosynthesis